MVVATFVVVVLRYVFDSGVIWLQESVIWMHAAVFMLGAAYTLQRDEHVRVDIFYRGMSESQEGAGRPVRRRILHPATRSVASLSLAWDYVRASWQIREVPPAMRAACRYPFVPLLKSVIDCNAGCVVLLQGVVDGAAICVRDAQGR